MMRVRRCQHAGCTTLCIGHDGAAWHFTGQAVPFEADRVPELLTVLERALLKLPNL